MPHVIDTKEGEAARKAAALSPPFGPGFSSEQTEKTEKMVVTGSSVNDPGDDWCEFEIFDAEGVSLAKKRIAGY